MFTFEQEYEHIPEGFQIIFAAKLVTLVRVNAGIAGSANEGLVLLEGSKSMRERMVNYMCFPLSRKNLLMPKSTR